MTPHKNNPYVHPHYVPVLKSVIEHLYTVGMPKTWSEQRQAAADIYQNHGYASPFPLDLVTARKRLMASIRMNQIPNWVKEDEELQPKYQHVVSQAKNCYRGIVVAKSEVQTDDDEYGGGWLNNTEEQSADEELQFDFDNPRVLTKKRAILKPKRFVDEGDTPFAPSERCIIRRLETAPIKQLPDEAEDMPVVEEKAVKLEQSPQPEQQEMPTVQQVMPVAEIPSEQDELEAAKAELENLKAIVAEQEEEIGELRQQLEVSEGIIDDFKVECHEKQIEIEWLKVHKGFDPATMKYDENPIHSYLEELKAAEEKNLAEMERQKLHFDYLVDETRAQETDLQAQNQAIAGQLLLIRTLQNKFFAATMGSDFEIPFADTADDDDILLTPQTSIERRISLPETPTIPEQTSSSPQPLLEDSEIFQTTPSLPNPRTSPMHQNDDQHVPADEAHSTTSIDTNHSFV